MKRLVLFFLVSFLGVTSVIGQELDSMMVVYELSSPAEKIHLHFDKNIYNKVQRM